MRKTLYRGSSRHRGGGPHTAIGGELPRSVRVVLAQKLFVDKTGLPSPLLNEIKRLAAFQNPEFYKKQSTEPTLTNITISSRSAP